MEYGWRISFRESNELKVMKITFFSTFFLDFAYIKVRGEEYGHI